MVCRRPHGCCFFKFYMPIAFLQVSENEKKNDEHFIGRYKDSKIQSGLLFLSVPLFLFFGFKFAQNHSASISIVLRW